MPDSREADRPTEELFDELFTLLEALEARNEAIAGLLKDQGIATDEKLQPYLEQAGNAASVRWRAARARMEHLFTPIPVAVQEAKKETESPQQKAVAQQDEQTDKKSELKGEAENETEDQNTTRESRSQSAKAAEDKPGAGNESKANESTSKRVSEKLAEASVGPGAANAAAQSIRSRAKK
jgi:signal recognition particle GTPase